MSLVESAFPTDAGLSLFPADAEFEEKLKTFDAYHFKRHSYFFRMLENVGRKEPVPTDEYTIEHILPQNEDLRTEWRAALGPDWEEIQAKYLHSLGNLTLTGYNSEYSDRPFPEKREMKGGFRESPLRLNQGLGLLDTWNEATIRDQRHASLVKRSSSGRGRHSPPKRSRVIKKLELRRATRSRITRTCFVPRVTHSSNSCESQSSLLILPSRWSSLRFGSHLKRRVHSSMSFRRRVGWCSCSTSR